MGDVIIRHANYGIELVDELTDGPLVGQSLVTFTPVGPLVASSGPVVFTVGRSRWVFEDLGQNVVFSIHADHYIGRVLETDADLPAVPPDDAPGVLAEVSLKPGPGYPFPPTLTRGVGQVRLHADVDPTEPVVVGAKVTITPMHGASPGANFETYTDQSGQYAVWFLPDSSLDPPWATGFDAEAEATVDIGGVPTLVTGSITVPALLRQTFNGAETIYLEE